MSIKKQLREIIKEIDKNKRRTITGNAVSSPKLKDFFGQKTWVVDVLIENDKELLIDVPIAPSNRNVANAVTENVPVELKRDNAGQFYVTGRSNVVKGEVVNEEINPSDLLFGLGFTQGWQIETEGEDTFVSGNGNPIDEGTPTCTKEFWVFNPVPYGLIAPYGSQPYGVKTAEKIIEDC